MQIPDGIQHVLLNQPMYTPAEVAKLLGVDTSTLRRWRRATPAQGTGIHSSVGTGREISASDLEEYLESRHIRPAQ
ncbi:helix-turn-helix domain-containing protein [Nocardia thraciensis]